MDDPYLPAEPRIISCCVHLRTKGMYYVPAELAAGPGFIEVTTTATYWCNRTSQAAGPDATASTPASCQPGRSCYERAAENDPQPP